ncbi:prostaglandin E2 receptor EP4 subtype-like [Saccostrea cucullata]|uniref:prostaglandin E2 receptor EP4 subtype-like n=1 Tax=Saccostrea cuccullata TaxID=36930 RepID=UPI002ED5E3C4
MVLDRKMESTEVTSYHVTQPTGLFSLLNTNGITQDLTTIMADDRTRMDNPCDSFNKTGCRQEGMGISLSTPIIMFTTGILGNILALVVLYTSRKEAKRTVFYTLLAGLAWTDLIGQLMTSPIAIVVYANNLKWVGGKPLCRYHAFAMILFGGLTPLLVCAMSVERLLALRFAYFHARVATKKKAFIAIAACWIIVMFFCSWPFVGLGSYEIQFPGSWCFLNFHKESVSDIIYASIFASTNIVIILLNLGCNIAVVVTLLQMRRKRVANNSPYCHRRHNTNQSKTKSMKREAETQMVIFLCAITLVFTTCWLPININIIMNQITGVTNRKADLLGVRFAGINQILDPWLYVLLRKALILKLVKYLHQKLWSRSKIEGTGRQILHSYENVPVDREHISLGALDDLQIKVLCVSNDKRPSNQDCEKEMESSDESMSSVSNLISANQHIDMGYHSNSSELRKTVTLNDNTMNQHYSDNRLSQSTKDSPRKRVKLKRIHSSPAFNSAKCSKPHKKYEKQSSSPNDDSVITI